MLSLTTNITNKKKQISIQSIIIYLQPFEQTILRIKVCTIRLYKDINN